MKKNRFDATESELKYLNILRAKMMWGDIHEKEAQELAKPIIDRINKRKKNKNKRTSYC